VEAYEAENGGREVHQRVLLRLSAKRLVHHGLVAIARRTYKSTELLEALKHTSNDERSPVTAAYGEQLRQGVVDSSQSPFPTLLRSLWSTSFSSSIVLFQDFFLYPP
jgi:hypothetical protein